jgi:IS30 family transposase
MSNPRAVVARRKEVMSLLAKCVTEEEIAKRLGVDQSTISRDIKALKIAAQKYIYDLDKSDLAYSYKQSIDGLHEINKEAWKRLREEEIKKRERWNMT